MKNIIKSKKKTNKHGELDKTHAKEKKKKTPKSSLSNYIGSLNQKMKKKTK